MIKAYAELEKLKTLEERYEYLKLRGKVGADTFGFERYLNQVFYRSSKWEEVRDTIILRDDGNELGLIGFPIKGKIYVHHLNPITLEQLERDDPMLYDSDNLVCVSYDMHQAIHYGSEMRTKSKADVVIRRPGDTCPWKETT